MDSKDQEIAELRVRLAKIEEQQVASPARSGSSFGKVVAWVGGIIAFGFFGLLLIAAMTPQETGADRVAKVDKACQNEYGPDQEAVIRCKLAIELKMIQDQQSAKMANAARASQ